ncbi:MAG: aminotransferase class I/II-fold pyridoxal phosphate-dependent enzyme [Gemmatimonadota bacterium]|nr:aminotransferase class I/II-fold pyridoxal phosphate-dependent enzyme [Gemmatimonadota bacterium]MDH3366441.1 aminotransferase class I/II-fold pyridoxal phosphate-dependent enzyme [Gemmatimonadota bacterium]MDH3476697.1 aminotransferase class I/II-fold pyridoxal phosphate-dependent enzyme [Gemmatimonadota bacterium]MDH3570199.1 aminotransferase class I/II-fold pyridoxal phosphate-dependent enzyme [Gemmatimonadota bacterium]MDH5549887.1 aminotransferase class I/II-fold pyridoxal phosphate-dep
MSFITFELERWQSIWEHRVRYNLSESGVHALSIEELLALAGEPPDDFLRARMGYGESDGTRELRTAIAAIYDGVNPENVTVTIGSAEANFVACWTLLEPGDRVAVLTPTYMQIPGLVRNFGAAVTEFRLRPDRNWSLDPADVERAVSPGTKLVVVTHPNNPTGHLLSAEAREAIVERSRAVGAWLLVDEVYQGAELSGRTTPSFWGSHDRTIVVSGLSKAYGLPGLRIGWLVSTPECKDALLRRHDYTVIGAGPASDRLATLALRSREAILARTRAILNANYPILESWLRGFGDLFDWRKPECGAITLLRYNHPMAACDLVECIRADYDILLVPGDHFGLPGHLRLGFGGEPAELEEALAVLQKGVRVLLR